MWTSGSTNSKMLCFKKNVVMLFKCSSLQVQLNSSAAHLKRSSLQVQLTSTAAHFQCSSLEVQLTSSAAHFKCSKIQVTSSGVWNIESLTPTEWLTKLVQKTQKKNTSILMNMYLMWYKNYKKLATYLKMVYKALLKIFSSDIYISDVIHSQSHLFTQWATAWITSLHFAPNDVTWPSP